MRTEHVFAEHGRGGDRYLTGPVTFIFADADKRQQLGWVKGHLADGATYRDEFGFRVIHLIGAERPVAA